MTILESLTSLSNYPIASEYVQATIIAEGLQDNEFTPAIAKDARYLRAKRRVCLYLVTAPNVTQGGISYTLDQKAREQFLDMASEIAEELADEGGRFGYIGDEL